MTQNQPATHQPRPGLWLTIVGALIAIGFTIYALVATPDSTAMPLWIVVGWGGLVCLYGLYRLIRGRSPLDHPRGGTDSGSDQPPASPLR